LNKGRAHRVLVVIRSAGDGLAAPRSGRNAVENLEEKIIWLARNARSAGEIIFSGRLRPSKPEAQPRHRQDSQKTRPRWERPGTKGNVADSASPHEGFAGLCPDVGKVNFPETGVNAPAA